MKEENRRMNQQRVCIIGGGVAAVGLWWTLAEATDPTQQWLVTVLHSETALGGHALTVTVPHGGTSVPVDTGVQFFVPAIYRTIDAILKRPEFAESVPIVSYDALKVGCSFPPVDGKPQKWGNFPDYGATNGPKPSGSPFGLYSQKMWNDAETFQSAVAGALIHRSRLAQNLDDYFAEQAGDYEDVDSFKNMFLYPYLSIINGYGASLSKQVTFADLLPLFGSFGSGSFWHGLARFTQPCQGYARFVNGAQNLVEALATEAAKQLPATVSLNSKVSAVYPDATNPQTVHVAWTDANGPQSGVFDKVVITSDMQSAGCMLANGSSEIWKSTYDPYVSPIARQLVPGYCVIHTDNTVLSPDMQNGPETLQFTADFAGDPAKPGGYDLFLTYTSYLTENIRGPEGKGLYLTMYGYLPEGASKQPPVCAGNPCGIDPVAPQPCRFPAPGTILFEEYWTHGMWLPQFMMKEKQALHLAQGPGKISYPGQSPYPIYFAGNNTTADSLEHALLSGAVIADYAFGAPFPVRDNWLAWGMFELFYREFMFPGASPSHHFARLFEHMLADR
jgi:NAD(P)-binding Rossmann-like domain